jgi:putative iron-regulated protein
MAKTAKLWTAIGVAVLAGTVAAESGVINPLRPIDDASFVLVDGEGGEGGESASTSSETIYALGTTDANAYTYDAKPQIDAYVALAYARYEKAADDAAILAKTVDAFLAAPSTETLDAARKSYVAARPAYMQTEAFRFYDGPIEAVEGEINAWPMNEAYIDYVEGKPNAGIINDPTFKLDVDSLEGSNQKQDEADVTIGWHAVEFLLWGQDLSSDGPGNRPYTDYIAGDGSNDRRRAYLKLVTDQLAKELHSLEETWSLENPKSYASAFKALPPREAIGRMVNGMAILAGYEVMSERLGVALDSGDQEDEQSCFSDTTKQDFVHDLVGIKAVWTEAKLNDLVKSMDPALALKVDGLFQDTESKIAKLGDPWDKVLAAPKESAERQNAEAVVVALQALADGLKAAGNTLGVLVLIPSG